MNWQYSDAPKNSMVSTTGANGEFISCRADALPSGTVIDPDPKDTLENRALQTMSIIRAERDKRLSATDYMAMPDYPNKPVNLNAYRQALRDFPATVNVSALSCPLDVAALNWPKL